MSRWLAALSIVTALAAPAAAQTLPSEAPTPTAPPAASSRDSAAGPDVQSGVDPERFGGARAADPAFGAYQRGLYHTALNLALPRARGGDPNAQTLVAEILSRGLGVKRNPAEAARWYALAAEQSVPEAQFQYALLLMDGRYVPRDEKAAFALMEASAEAGSALAQFNFGQILATRGPGENGLGRALTYYRRAAEQGLPDAQYAMSQIISTDTAGAAGDDVKAREWLERAARQNFDTAQLDLGTWLINGRGGPRDMKAGFGWMSTAAAGGNVAARNRLAKLYVAGLGTEPDVLQGAAWYILAKRAGLRDPEMEDVMAGLTADETRQALERANRLP